MTAQSTIRTQGRAVALARPNRPAELVFEFGVLVLACAALALVGRAAGAFAPLVLLAMLAIAGPFAVAVGLERRSLRAAALTGSGAVLAVTVMIPFIGLVLDGSVRMIAALMPV